MAFSKTKKIGFFSLQSFMILVFKVAFMLSYCLLHLILIHIASIFGLLNNALFHFILLGHDWYLWEGGWAIVGKEVGRIIIGVVSWAIWGGEF
jgi:hypothetical protein